MTVTLVRATCSVDGCNREYRSRGLCDMHHKRWLRHGDPLHIAPSGKSRPGNRQTVVGYVGAHERVRTRRGKASRYPCAHCMQPAHDWAYDHADSKPLVGMVNGSLLEYSTDPNHYLPLCKACHFAFDLRS